ncbi:dihydroxyacetone kinase subunit DhaK [Bacillus sp. FJAT-52991]|uniref:Dihydroxyacetone kinase subunit DhaK n=1 Tax=Bacillus kandeliae TaxID=3129297 RepID=A0ABZ2N9S4_9BACI
MKKIINHPENAVKEMLEGFAAAYPDSVEYLADHAVIKRKHLRKGKVAIISGGGSGHEPAHAGYVGEGMLDAAVAGEVFTSPAPDQILAAMKAVNTGAGVLLIIKNYSGDVMNFDMAAELAEMDGIPVETVIVNDDVAVEDSLFTTGRRGIAGTVFIHKIAGALAEKGASLSEIKQVCERAIERVRSMGMALSPCVIPTSGKPSFTIGETEMELGMGIHGEPGLEREPLQSAANIAEALAEAVLHEEIFQTGDELAVMINGLGATPMMELYIVNRTVQQLLKDKGFQVIKIFIGEYMTSLEMSGCSLTLFQVDEQLKELLLAPSDAPAFKC